MYFRLAHLPLLLTSTAIYLSTHTAVMATAGLAEWEIRTPGGNLISSIDPLKSSYGICLRKADQTQGLISTNPADIYVSHLEWWNYYKGYVAGKGKQYFLFNEKTRKAQFFATEPQMLQTINVRGLGTPISKRLTAQDGWNQTWSGIYRENCKRMLNGSPEFTQQPLQVQERMRSLCQQWLK